MERKLTTQIAAGVHLVRLGMVNAYIVEVNGMLLLVDTGFPRSARTILAAVDQLGYSPSDLKDIILTHAHPDHVGSAAEIVRITGAQTWMHKDDVAAAQGAKLPAVRPADGFVPKLFYAALHLLPRNFEGVRIDHIIEDEDILPFGDLQAIHAPGHCRGQIVLYTKQLSLLFAADSCMNIRGLRQPSLNEDAEESLRSLRRISALDFDIACFGHGRFIADHACQRFREKFG